MANLSSLLEEASGRRQRNLPSVSPTVAPPMAPPIMPQAPQDSGTSLESLLPALLGAAGMQGGMQGESGPVGSSGGTPSHWENVAQRMATNKYGYSNQDFNKLDSIIDRESSWDPNAVNPNGGAYGIPQILPSAHPNTHLEDNPRGQIKWLLNYIDERYGGIDQALAFKDREGWY